MGYAYLMASGEVLLSGTQQGTEGSVGFELANLTDGNSLTSWSTYPSNGTQPWAGIDAGTPCTLTRVLISAVGGGEDYLVGSNIQASLISGFMGPQGSVNVHTSSATSNLSCGFGTPNSSGSAIVVGLVFSDFASVSTVFDSNGNSYSQAVTQDDSGNTLKQSIYIATNIASGPNLITAVFSGMPTYIAMVIWEQPGVALSSAVDGTAAAFNSSGTTSQSSGNLTTTQSGDIIFGLCLSGQVNGITPGVGYTTQVGAVAGSDYIILESQVVGAGGTYSATSTTGTGIAWVMAAVALKPSGGGYGAPVTNLKAISTRALNGNLINQYIPTQSQPYQFYRYLSSSISYGSIADLDFYATYTAGIAAAAVDPILSPWGGNYDKPIVVRLSSTTTDAVIYYTLDGTTPSISSTPYSVPFSVGSTSTLNAVSVSSGLTNSRVSSAKFYISPNSIISTDTMPLDNRGIRMWAVDPWIFQDPISKYWYMYGINLNEGGVVTEGAIGTSIYKSIDLRNWSYIGIINTPPVGLAKNYNTYTARPVMLYNANNNTYVYWTHTSNNLLSSTSTSPEGPFTAAGSYPTLLASGGVNSDFFVFLDSDGVTAYIGFGDTGLNHFYFAQLDTTFTNVLGTGGTFNIYASVATFGQKLDGMHMFKNASTYFLMSSLPTNWTPNLNRYWTSSSPLGPWTLVGNPYQPVAGAIPGTYTDNTVAFNTQNDQVLSVPGRNAAIYIGDAFNTGLNKNTGSSMTASFEAYTMVTLPVTFPTSSTMSITWNNDWNLDSVFPTVSGGPLPATNLTVSGTSATWTNHETHPANLYLDNSNDPTFSTGIISEIVPLSATSFTITPSIQSGAYFKVRTVNANGSGVSNIYPTPPPPPPPPPPPIGSVYDRDSYYDILLRSILRVRNTEALTYPEQTLTEPHSLTHGISPANDIPPEYQNEYVKLYILSEYKYRV